MIRPFAAVVALSLLGAVSACGGTDSSADTGQTVPEATAAAPAATAEVLTKVKSVRPAYLVTQEKPFSAEQVKAIRELKGVGQVALIGYKQLSMYDRQLATAAVDPVTFRPFTYPDTANSAPLWTAVRDGDGLISHEVGTRDHLPLAASMPVGWGTLRFAGLATTVPGIDLTVGVITGRSLGVPFGNGVVLSADSDAQQLKQRLAERLGAAALVRPIVTAATAPAGGSIL
ncbi:hypothetical protein, partial [Actinocorallia lasiicapitis]